MKNTTPMRGIHRLFACTLLLLAMASHAHEPRIIALGGDVTGIVHALGSLSEVVAVDNTSTWPASVKKLPDVGYVRQLNTEGILALNPSHILATHGAGPPDVLKQLQHFNVQTTQLNEAQNLKGIVEKVQQIGAVLNKPEQANTLQQQLEQQASILAQRVASMAYHPRAVVIMSTGTSGLMVAGNNTAAEHAITLAGGQHIVTDYSGYKPLSNEALITLQPDVLLLMQTSGNTPAETLLQLPAVKQTPAGKHQRVKAIDGEALLGFGVRTLEHATQLQAYFGDISNHE